MYPFNPTSARARLVSALGSLARCAHAISPLVFTFPDPPEIRIRKVVHRGICHPAYKTFSLKLNRMVHCESPLEMDASLLFDPDPSVTGYAEQAFRVRYPIGEDTQTHVPDFVVLLDGRLVVIEVKFAVDVTDEVIARTNVLRAELKPLGASYVLLTEHEIRRSCAVSSAVRLLRVARFHEVSPVLALRTVAELQENGPEPLGDFNLPRATALARLVFAGHACIDPINWLNSGSVVHPCNNKEKATWLPAISA